MSEKGNVDSRIPGQKFRDPVRDSRKMAPGIRDPGTRTALVRTIAY